MIWKIVENLAAHIMSSFFVFSYVSSRYMEMICRSVVMTMNIQVVQDVHAREITLLVDICNVAVSFVTAKSSPT
jgi:hypothetical protein